MGLQSVNGISLFLFVISCSIPCGFSSKVKVDALNNHHEFLVDSLQTRHEGILREPLLTASAVQEKVKVKNNKIGPFLVKPGFPFETSASLEIPQHSMQILPKSRNKSKPTPHSSFSSGKVSHAAPAGESHDDDDDVVVAEANGKIIVDSGGAIPQAKMLGCVADEANANISTHNGKDCNQIITKRLNRVALQEDEEGSAHHQNSLRKRSISPPFLFLSILMDYSSPIDEEREASLDKRRPRAHRSFRTFGPGQDEKDHELVEKQESSFLSGQNLVSGGGGGGDDVEPALVHHNASFIEDASSSQAAVVVPSASSSCPVGHFECTNNPSLCVPQSAICNGKPECPDFSDEYKCVNIHEKKFWDSFFQKRPSADIEGNAGGNMSCLYTDSKWEQNQHDLQRMDGEQEQFHELLAKGLCRCSREKVLCHNVHLPDLHSFPKDIQFLDLSGSRIDKLQFPSDQFQQLSTLVLSSCAIEEIFNHTFSSLNNLNVLHLTGNQLKWIPDSAFTGNRNLSKLFLGHNQINSLNSKTFHGLSSLEYLDLRNNKLTGKESEVFLTLASLKVLHLSFNEIRLINEDFLRGPTQLEMLSLTKNKISSIMRGAMNHTPLLRHLLLSYNRLSVLEDGMFCSLQDLLNLNLNDNGIRRIEPRAFECLDSLQSLKLHSFYLNRTIRIDYRSFWLWEYPSCTPVRIRILEKNPFRDLYEQEDDDVSDPKQFFANLTSLQHIYFDEWWMCSWAPFVRSCEPKGDGISSVDNLLDNVILRVCVWIMGVVGVAGNLFVIISRLVIREKNRAHSFYIKNLALADLLMGLFLMSIAFHDVSFRGHFLAHQNHWRHSITCQLSGMLSTLSSESSVFILFLITLDRYLSIVRPFAERRNALVPAILIVVFVWTISIFLSYAPMCPWFRGYFGKSFYTSNGLCLPLHIHNPFETGWEYSLFLFIVVNSIAFIFICYAYWKMLRIIKTSNTSVRSTQQKQDGMLVKRFGLVVATDFLCWAPIILIKCIAMAGVEIQSDLYAWLAVFVLPVNSALNPVIYTLSTKLFKQQVSHLQTGLRKRLGLASDDSTTSSLLYRNRISRTLQTSLNSSMMLSTRRHGESGSNNPVGVGTNSTRVTVIKDRTMVGSRMSKVSNISPQSGNITAVSATSAVTTDAATTISGGHVVPSGVGAKAEINGQILQYQQPLQLRIDASGKEFEAESQL